MDVSNQIADTLVPRNQSGSVPGAEVEISESCVMGPLAAAGELPQRRVVWMWFGAFPGAFGLGRAQPQRRGTSP